MEVSEESLDGSTKLREGVVLSTTYVSFNLGRVGIDVGVDELATRDRVCLRIDIRRKRKVSGCTSKIQNRFFSLFSLLSFSYSPQKSKHSTTDPLMEYVM